MNAWPPDLTKAHYTLVARQCAFCISLHECMKRIGRLGVQTVYTTIIRYSVQYRHGKPDGWSC